MERAEQASEQPSSIRVLIVDDDPDVCQLLQEDLRERGYATVGYTRPEDALDALEAESFDVVITDARMPRIDGVALCRRVRDDRPGVPVIVLTAFADTELTLEALRAGAADFVTKPHRPEGMEEAIARALRRRSSARIHRLPEEALPSTPEPDGLLGSSVVMRDLRRRIRMVGASDTTVLVVGESGTGKELVARALHRASPRREGPFVAIDCAAVPEHLIESELFGHVRGAFTDATEDRRGLFVRAAGGTLLLDEIDSLGPSLQPKLLRVLQERTVRRVGAEQEERFDARLVAATNRDPFDSVREGRLREDLLYRIDVLRIELPPLRERGDDVVELAQHFLGELASESAKNVTRFTPEALDRLRAYEWPGNVRELRNCVESALALAHEGAIDVDQLPAAVRKAAPREHAHEALPTLEQLERQHIERVLRAVEGNKVEAARILGISRATLYRRLQSGAGPTSGGGE